MKKNEDLIRIVGEVNYCNDQSLLKSYASDQSFEKAAMPMAVCWPVDTDQVEALINWANTENVPLTPISSESGPRFNGDSIPTEGGLMVDLSRMKKISNIYRSDRVAVIEAGVTFAELQAELDKNGLRANVPLLPREGKSVLASYLEREPILVPREHWDGADPLCCTQIVFGTGEKFRTGSANVAGDIEEHNKAGLRYVNPQGPGTASLARMMQGAQGTMGIVTWASVFCRVKPQLEQPRFAGSDDLNSLVKLCYSLLKRRLGEEMFIVNAQQLSMMLFQDRDDIERTRRALPAWVLFVNFAGLSGQLPEERVTYQLQDAGGLAAEANVFLRDALDEITAEQVLEKLYKSTPRYYKLNYKGRCVDIPFLSTLDHMERLSDITVRNAGENGIAVEDVGIYLQPNVNGCSCHAEINIPYADDESTTINTAYPILAKLLSEAGAHYSRPYGQLAKIAYEDRDSLVDILRRVKKIFDPQQIMNPGKLCFHETCEE